MNIIVRDVFISVFLFLAAWIVYYFIYNLFKKYPFWKKTISRLYDFEEDEISRKNFLSRAFKNFLLLFQNIETATPILFFLFCLFSISMVNDLWYHDHYGLDKPWSPAHIPYYTLMPFITLAVLGVTADRKRSSLVDKYVYYLWFGIFCAISGLIINVFWHAYGLAESYIAPPHELFFIGIYIMLILFYKIFNYHLKNTRLSLHASAIKITYFLFYLSVMLLIFIDTSWLIIPQDLGGSGFVDISQNIIADHPSEDASLLMSQIQTLRHLSIFTVPAIYTIIISSVSTIILKKYLFPGALTLIVLINFTIFSFFHFSYLYIPVIVFPIAILDFFCNIFPSVKKKFLPLLVGLFTSLLFYLIYYPYSLYLSNITWPQSYVYIITITMTILSICISSILYYKFLKFPSSQR